MKLYIAGNFAYTIKPSQMWARELRMLRAVGAHHRLVSYAWLDASHSQEIAAGYRAAGVESLFIDSGAFSASRSGTRIHLPAYCRCIDQLKPDVYAVLDVIGDQQATMRNQQRMERLGYHPLPVFTRGGDWGVLRDLAQTHEYIALGNLVGHGIAKDRLRFLDRVFSTCPPPVRFHGFGVTGGDLLLEFPFYSVDSSSALLSTALGSATTYREGKLTSGRPGRRQAHLDDGIMGRARHWERRAEAIRDYIRLEGHVTKVWEARGVSW